MGQLNMFGCRIRIFLVVFASCLASIHANCKVGDAKWQGAPVVTNSVAGKVKVDWSKAIYNPACVDEYHLWMWKDGSTKQKGKKLTMRNNKVMDKEVDVPPCVFTNIGLDSVEKDLFNTHTKESPVVRFNSADLPSFNVSLSDLQVSYYRDPSSGEFSLTTALVSLPTKFLSFAPCLKEIEVSAQRPAEAIKTIGKKSASKTKTTTTSSAPSLRTRLFGKDRQPGESGPPSSMHWGHEDGVKYGSGFNPGSVGGSQTSSGSGSGYNAGISVSTARPPSKTGNWNYDTASKIGTGVGSQGFNPGAVPTHAQIVGSPFNKQFLRMKSIPPAATVTKQSSPFPGERVMIKVPVEACTPQELTVRFISKDGSELGKLPPVELPALADIPDYIPPPMSQVVSVSVTKGNPSVSVQSGSSVPESCLPQYMEAVDAFANRIEDVAEGGATENKKIKDVQQVQQKKVETVKREILGRHGCLCASPQLRLELSQSGGTQYKTVKADHKTEVFGVYLYQGMREGRPYYKLDLEGRRLEKESTAATPLIRRKRFIGRIDGATTTTNRPWNFGVVGGAQVDRGYSRSSSSSSSFSRSSSSRMSSSPGGSKSYSRSASSSSSTTWTNIPIQRVNSSPIPYYLFWETKAKQWLVSDKLGSLSQDSDFGSVVGSKFQCPADGSEVWQVRSPSLRSGAGRWQEEPALSVTCLE